MGFRKPTAALYSLQKYHPRFPDFITPLEYFARVLENLRQNCESGRLQLKDVRLSSPYFSGDLASGTPEDDFRVLWTEKFGALGVAFSTEAIEVSHANKRLWWEAPAPALQALRRA